MAQPAALYEARLGREKFGKEVNAYSVAYSTEEGEAVARFADKVIFNSISQLNRLHDRVSGLKVGLRVNPGLSYSHFDLADPARKYSRLGVCSEHELDAVASLISDVMFYFNCENDDVENIAAAIDRIGTKYASLLKDGMGQPRRWYLFYERRIPAGKILPGIEEFQRKIWCAGLS